MTNSKSRTKNRKKWIANSEKEIREYRKSLEDTEKELDILQTKFDEQTKYIEHFQEIENKYENIVSNRNCPQCNMLKTT